VDHELGRVLESSASVTTSPVGLVVVLGAEITRTRRRGEVVFGLVVRGSVEHGAGAIAAGPHFHGGVVLGDQLRVESGGGEVVAWVVDDLGLEDIT